MSKIDASRFLAHLQKVFAPKIIDGQEFIAYIDGDSNSLIIQAENVINASTSNSSFDSEAVENLALQLSALQSKANSLEITCRNIPALQTQIQTLSGESEGLIDFEYAFLIDELGEVKGELAECVGKIATLEEMYHYLENALDNSSLLDDSSSSNEDVSETISRLETKIINLENTVNELSSVINSQVVSETEYDLSE